MRGLRGSCLCERVHEATAFVERISSQLALGAFAMKGHELDKLARSAIALDKFVRAIEGEASNSDDVGAFDWAQLSVEELETLNALFEKIHAAPMTKAAPAVHNACPHVELLQTTRELVNEQITSKYFPLASYEQSNLSSKALALDALIREYEDEVCAPVDHGALNGDDFAIFVALTEKARRV